MRPQVNEISLSYVEFGRTIFIAGVRQGKQLASLVGGRFFPRRSYLRPKIDCPPPHKRNAFLQQITAVVRGDGFVGHSMSESRLQNDALG